MRGFARFLVSKAGKGWKTREFGSFWGQIHENLTKKREFVILAEYADE